MLILIDSVLTTFKLSLPNCIRVRPVKFQLVVLCDLQFGGLSRLLVIEEIVFLDFNLVFLPFIGALFVAI